MRRSARLCYKPHANAHRIAWQQPLPRPRPRAAHCCAARCGAASQRVRPRPRRNPVPGPKHARQPLLRRGPAPTQQTATAARRRRVTRSYCSARATRARSRWGARTPPRFANPTRASRVRNAVGPHGAAAAAARPRWRAPAAAAGAPVCSALARRRARPRGRALKRHPCVQAPRPWLPGGAHAAPPPPPGAAAGVPRDTAGARRVRAEGAARGVRVCVGHAR